VLQGLGCMYVKCNVEALLGFVASGLSYFGRCNAAQTPHCANLLCKRLTLYTYCVNASLCKTLGANDKKGVSLPNPDLDLKCQSLPPARN